MGELGDNKKITVIICLEDPLAGQGAFQLPRRTATDNDDPPLAEQPSHTPFIADTVTTCQYLHCLLCISEEHGMQYIMQVRYINLHCDKPQIIM